MRIFRCPQEKPCTKLAARAATGFFGTKIGWALSGSNRIFQLVSAPMTVLSLRSEKRTTNFGQTTPLSFTGDTQDTIAGLFDTPNRELHPNQGRWISPDPAGMSAVDPSNPQSWNRYAYALNNPLRNVDPTGLDCVTVDGDGNVTGTEGGDCPDIDPNNEYYINCDDCLDDVTFVGRTGYDSQGNSVAYFDSNYDYLLTNVTGSWLCGGNCPGYNDGGVAVAANNGLLFPSGVKVRFQTSPNVTFRQWLHAAYDCALSPAPLPTKKGAGPDSPSDSADRLEGNSLDRSNQIYLPQPNGQQVAVTGGSSPGLNTAADAAGLELGWAGCMQQEVGGPGEWP
jgi:RHS repeat-associated protein